MNLQQTLEYFKKNFPDSYDPKVLDIIGRDNLIDTQSESARKKRVEQTKKTYGLNQKTTTPKTKVQPVTTPKTTTPKRTKSQPKTQIKTQPKTTVSAPKQPVQTQPVFAPINVAEQINYGINPTYPQVPSFGYGNAFDLAEQLNAQQLINNQENQKLNFENQQTAIAQAIASSAQMALSVEDANKSTIRSINESIYSANEMVANSKGYLTVQEQIAKSVNDVSGQYRSQLNSLIDQKTTLERMRTDWKKGLDMAKEALDNPLISDEQRSNLTEYVKTLDDGLKSVDNQITKTSQLIDVTRYYEPIEKSATQILETENKRIEALTKIADLEANIATARYNQGGTLINEASIIKARIDGIKMIRDAELEYQKDQGKFLPPDFVAKTKELADINLSQSYVDAIPFLKEFSANLKDVILQTTTWQDALKKTLDLVAGTVLNQMVILPFQNAIAGFAKNLGLFGNFVEGTDYFIPNYANGIDEALTKERAMSGKKPYLAALHEGEAVLSTLNGDSALYRNLKRTGQWDELKTGDQIPNFARGTDSGASSGNRNQSSSGSRGGGGTVVINHNQTIVTPNADSFNSGKRQRNQDLIVQLNKSLGR